MRQIYIVGTSFFPFFFFCKSIGYRNRFHDENTELDLFVSPHTYQWILIWLWNFLWYTTGSTISTFPTYFLLLNLNSEFGSLTFQLHLCTLDEKLYKYYSFIVVTDLDFFFCFKGTFYLLGLNSRHHTSASYTARS